MNCTLRIKLHYTSIMPEDNEYESDRPSVTLPPRPEMGGPGKRRRPNTPPATQSESSAIEWSPSPPRSLLEKANEKYEEFLGTPRNQDGDGGQDLATTNTPKLFRSEPIRAELTRVMNSFPSEDDQRSYTSQHPLVCRVRSLIRARTVTCPLCALYEWGPIVYTHKLKRCSHREEAGEAHPWLEMFRHYRARGGGPGARCSHCRFPIMLCWRTVYREKMDDKYGSEVEARENEDSLYHEVQCTWVQAMQRFVTSCMVFHRRGKDGGVSRLGGTVLDVMGW
jgi:hypothetical protein